MINLFLMALSTVNLSATTTATAAVAMPTAQQQPVEPVKEKLVCRTQERIGSRVGGKRVCNTKARWAEIEAESGAAVRDAQRSMSSMPTNGT